MGSKKRLAAAAALLVVIVAACSNGDASRGQVKDTMVNAGIDEDQANCVANQLDPEAGVLTQEELNDIAKESDIGELSGRALANDSDEDMADFVRSVLDDCVGGESSDAADEPEADPEGEPAPDDGGDTTTTTE